MSLLATNPAKAREIAGELYQAVHHLNAALEGLHQADAPGDVLRHLDQCNASIHNAARLIDPTRGEA